MADAAPQDQEPEAPAAEEPTPAPAEEEAPAEPLKLEVPEFSCMTDAMAWVWGEVRRVPKSGTHPSQGWKFATESDIADLIRDLCAHAGIVIHQTIRRHSAEIIGNTRNSQPIWRHSVTVMYQLRWKGEVWPLTKWKGEADDSSDKGLAKALTACRKTYLIATFQVSSGDDPDRAETPQVEETHQLTRRPKGSQAPAGEYRAPSNKAAPPTEVQQQEASRLRLALAQALNERGTEDPDALIQKFVNTKAQKIGVAVREMNTDEFEVLLDELRGQAAKLLPGWDPKTGAWADGTGPAAAKPSDDGEVAPPPAASQAPAQAPQAPVPADVPPAVQQAIEGAAAETPMAGAPVDPDLPPPKPGDTYRQSLELAARHGIEEVRMLEMMMEAGAAKPEDLDSGSIQITFLNLLDQAVEEMRVPVEPTPGQEELGA